MASNIDIRHYAGFNSETIIAIAKSRETGVGAAILDAVKLKESEVTNSVKRRPRLDDGDITKDMRYLVGFTAGLNWVLDLAPNARKLINGLSKSGVPGEADDDDDSDVIPARDNQGLPA